MSNRQMVRQLIYRNTCIAFQIAYETNAIELSDSATYPFFARTSGSIALNTFATFQLVEYFNWTAIGVLTAVGDTPTQVIDRVLFGHHKLIKFRAESKSK